MKVRFTKRATTQISAALDYVAEQSPKGAANIRDRLRQIVSLLADHPYLGRVTDRPGTRRLVTAPYPYVIDYRVSASEIVILRFRHAARHTT